MQGHKDQRSSLRFYAELNDFLPAQQRGMTIEHAYKGLVSVKDMIESLGPPHTEIDLILVNGNPVDFSYLVNNGDRVSVFPVFQNIDISQISQLGVEPLQEIKFILDTHLGRLAAFLRMVGFDTLYSNAYEDHELAQTSSKENRILLTRDRGVLKRKVVTHGYYVREVNPRRQLIEVLQRYRLFDAIQPFKRCVRCNGLLVPVNKEDIIDQLPPRTQEYFDVYSVCSVCDQIYWKGSHHERMEQFIAEICDRERIQTQ